ncbi:MAG: tripartite tricarboxylate transporter substrate binding protein [Pigmentiphaga sp.]|uniref:Bug family tripartite tricarboxylate transporter substrate binding protein n=1 Tax=Pigmentiphaga sp. TaxID=1977564 RepID=UPI0029AA9C3B|nr:tripartite tricarboxylate transporter substrate binding protein [Pigmentiphaga sp.]MDX3906760.1 tripartite tricarboxylate transporter substrate binding protein [Pigmentiphaga sp.]
MSIRLSIFSAVVSAAALLGGPVAAADTAYPKGPTTMIVPFPAGGPTDVLARIVSQQLAETWKHPVIVDYKPGASTMLGTAAVARAAADGTTIGVVNSAYVINPSLQKKLLYKNEDLTAVTQLIRVPLAIAANPDAPFNTLDEMIAYAKRNPGKVTFASPGTGGTSHLAGELLAHRAGLDLVHVPYKGSAPAHTDVIGGRVMVMIDPIFSLMPHIKSGRMKLLATTGPKREAAHPDYPAVAEKYPGVTVQAFIGLVVPTGTPQPIIDKIQRDSAAALALPAVKERVEGLGMAIVASSPSDFAARIKEETAQWAEVIREAKIELQD